MSPVNVLSARPLADVPTGEEGTPSIMTTSNCDVTAPDTPVVIKVIAGVDTHKDTHHVAVLAMTGAQLGDRQVPATAAGYAQLLDFVRSFGAIALIGIEGTASYGAGLARHLAAEGVQIREIIRPKRAHQRRGKSDPIDAYAAASQALAEPEALPMAKTTNGAVEQVRVLLVVRRSAIKARTAALRQITSLLVTAPEALRAKFAALTSCDALLQALAATRPHPAGASVTATTGHALRILARRHQRLTQQITDLDSSLRTLLNTAVPALLATPGIGLITAATRAVSAGDNPTRLRSEASFAALCGAAPIPASSGKTNRHRLNRGGDRQANWALHQIALVRLSTDPRTKAYASKLRSVGKSTKDVLRCLKRAIAREVYHLLVHPEPVPRTDDLRQLRQAAGLSLTHIAEHLGTWPIRISELERGLRPNRELTNRYRTLLNAA